ncbi:MAG: CDP-alcohol phosphatidyltransferase family protein [Proteobacteria bacterium]|nr:CDP-alcohol phosphatidyltransferase family protein [Pseudomonadota bacterium]
MNVQLSPSPQKERAALRFRTGVYVTLGGGAVAAIATAVASLSPFTEGFVIGALIPYLIVGLVVVAKIAAYHPYETFGVANALTLTRLVITALLGGLAYEVTLHGLKPIPWIAWSFCAMAVGAIVVDGLDGYSARRQNLASDFGGRFDMEVDALQILLLCVVAVALEKAGAWILIGGALRYAYEIAAVFWSALKRPLPPSFRRKLISVVMGSTLAALLAPVITLPFSTILAAVALALLIYSFAVDVIWLAVDDARARRAAG